MSFDIYSDRAVEAMEMIREFAHVEYWDYFKGDPERALEAFCVMQDAAEAKSAARIAELTEQLVSTQKTAIERGADLFDARTKITDLEAQVCALHKQLGYETKPDNSQDWAGISGAVAFHLIERHADNWSEAGDMMEAFAASRALKAAGGVPPGYALVPLEPTAAMIDAYNDVPSGFAGSPPYGGHVWSAMLAAAPIAAVAEQTKQQEPSAYLHPTSDNCVSTDPNAYEDAIPLFKRGEA